jgi:hypothetical protein
MAELASPFSCDVCHVHKGAGNHWFRVWLNPAGLVTIGTWEKRPAIRHFHCCGEEHALRKAGELLSELKSSARIES